MNLNQTYRAYDEFAGIYNENWGSRYGQCALPKLRNLFLDNLPHGSKLLDLCCGSGHVSQVLINEGYEVMGLDGSKALLDYAKINAPNVKFIHGDARCFKLQEEFNACVCLNDSLNHVLRYSELLTVFTNVKACLTDGGWFVFDLNLAHKYETSWSGRFDVCHNGKTYHITATIKHPVKLAYLTVKLALNTKTSISSSDIELIQTWYEIKEVVDGLQQAGFKSIKVTDRYGKNVTTQRNSAG